jgi:hypothetical protein
METLVCIQCTRQIDEQNAGKTSSFIWNMKVASTLRTSLTSLNLKRNRFLEGTGSMVLDRVHRKAYAAISPRTDETALLHFCEEFDYEPVAFSALQSAAGNRLPIYHTNVMMSIGSGFCAICLDSIDDEEEREAIQNELKGDGLEVIPLTEAQIEQFAGNMLELQGSDGLIIAMSSSAFNALNSSQIEALERFGTIVHADLTTIETCGGGSARCMIAEIHLPKAQAL